MVEKNKNKRNEAMPGDLVADHIMYTESPTNNKERLLKMIILTQTILINQSLYNESQNPQILKGFCQ